MTALSDDSKKPRDDRQPFWKRIAKYVAATVAVLAPVLLAAYEAEVIMSHVLVPAFSTKEHAIATLILMGVVIALAAIIMLAVVRRVKERAARQGGDKVRQLWNDQVSEIGSLVESTERLRKRFENSHPGETSPELYNSLRRNSASLLRRWYGLVVGENQRQEVRLAASALDCYLSELVRLKQPATNSTLLLANFEIYAFCVQAILKELIDFRPSSNGTIYVSTILSMPLSRWYNLSTEVNQRGDLMAFTRERWELYRKLASRLKTDPEEPEHWVQGRRILTSRIRSKVAEGLYILTRPDGKPHPVVEARVVPVPHCMELLDEVRNTLNDGRPDRMLYLLARHRENEPSCSVDHGLWKKLREEHFEPTFHNRVHSSDHIVYVEDKGMFCAYGGNAYPVSQYQDVFAVDLSSVGEGAFGIGYHKDTNGERSGIVFFGDAEVKEHLQRLDRMWNLAAEN